ncbi:hypothetical protein [Hanstruepera marina]|uniref:hypothetical protein n=1 Tax=Hanstruepera marina TaxID=2873265 RepID=UPI001CA71EF3|nr:hypothetical protein [Hanstruepera marina]
MRYLIISLFVCCTSCASYPKKQGLSPIVHTAQTVKNSYFSDTAKDYVYKANIMVYDHNFSGLFIVKKTSTNSHRVAFTTEMGNKLFDFSFTESDFKINYILDELNKKMLINILKSDFQTLTHENFKVSQVFTKQDDLVFKSMVNNKHYYLYKENELYKIIRTNKTKEKVVFTYSEINNSFANNIIIEHKNIKLNITLKSISQ